MLVLRACWLLVATFQHYFDFEEEKKRTKNHSLYKISISFNPLYVWVNLSIPFLLGPQMIPGQKMPPAFSARNLWRSKRKGLFNFSDWFRYLWNPSGDHRDFVLRIPLKDSQQKTVAAIVALSKVPESIAEVKCSMYNWHWRQEPFFRNNLK